jgi:hypothetical protein
MYLKDHSFAVLHSTIDVFQVRAPCKAIDYFVEMCRWFLSFQHNWINKLSEWLPIFLLVVKLEILKTCHISVTVATLWNDLNTLYCGCFLLPDITNEQFKTKARKQVLTGDHIMKLYFPLSNNFTRIIWMI